MKKIKQFISIVKVLWANKKYRALISLLFYFAFFSIIAIMFNMSSKYKNIDNNINKNILTTIEKYCVLSNYDRNITIINNENTLVLENKKYNDSDIYNVISDTSETYEVDSILYNSMELNNVDYIINMSKFNNEYICKYVDSASLEYETKYSSGIVKKRYKLSVSDFIRLYDEKKIINDDLIFIDIYELNDTITEIDIDLSDYIKLIDENTSNYNIKFEYISETDVKE